MGSNRRKIISYIAMSLDGKIARLNGAVDWLDTLPNPDKLDYGYSSFIADIDITIMGNATYQEVLGFGIEFPYKGKTNYVLTRDKTKTVDENVTFISSEFESQIEKLIAEPGKDIWLIGGSQLNSLFLKNGWLDEMRVFVMPIVLGGGIPLFSSEITDVQMKLIKTKTFDTGVVELTYKPLDYE